VPAAWPLDSDPFEHGNQLSALAPVTRRDQWASGRCSSSQVRVSQVLLGSVRVFRRGGAAKALILFGPWRVGGVCWDVRMTDYPQDWSDLLKCAEAGPDDPAWQEI
jgi:hypothetical protein